MLKVFLKARKLRLFVVILFNGASLGGCRHYYLIRFSELQRQEERKRRELERQRVDIQNELEDIDEETWSPELQLLNQTVIYLRKLVDKAMQIEAKEEERADKKKEDDNTSTLLKAEDGMIAMKPKKER